MIHTKIARYGNSLTVRLPATLARELDLREGDSLGLRRVENGLLLERPANARLRARLDTVHQSESEAGAGRALGAECSE